MRFIRKEHIITTIFNKELTEEQDIQTVFKNLHSCRVEFSLIMKKFMPHQHDYFNMNFEKVKIKRINDDRTLDLIAFKKGIQTSMKNVSYDDLGIIPDSFTRLGIDVQRDGDDIIIPEQDRY